MMGVVVVNLIAGLLIAVVLAFPGPGEPASEKVLVQATMVVLGVGVPVILLFVFLKWMF